MHKDCWFECCPVCRLFQGIEQLVIEVPVVLVEALEGSHAVGLLHASLPLLHVCISVFDELIWREVPYVFKFADFVTNVLLEYLLLVDVVEHEQVGKRCSTNKLPQFAHFLFYFIDY